MDLVNKVDASGILSVDLKDYQPREKVVFFDISPHLHMGLMLKEKEFRASLENTDWEQFRGKAVAIGCSTDAIIPTWAYMMLADKLQGIAACADYTTPENLALQLWKDNIRSADFSQLHDQKVAVKAGQTEPSLYITITDKLKPLVKTLMYGEAGLPKVIYKK
jgi:hypothetical protein